MLPLFRLKAGVSLVLASGSPRRRDFLAGWGVPFAVRPASAEPDPGNGEDPLAFVARSAAAKLASSGWSAGELVVAADTVVVHAGQVLGKPENGADALRMLKGLSGQVHEVVTGVALRFPDGGSHAFADVCRVSFHPWDEAVLAAYVATGECGDKAGAYAVQGQGAFLVDRIDGSWSTVVGLPVSRLASLLANRGWLLPAGGK